MDSKSCNMRHYGLPFNIPKQWYDIMEMELLASILGGLYPQFSNSSGFALIRRSNSPPYLS
jgi:hypothetical protein